MSDRLDLIPPGDRLIAPPSLGGVAAQILEGLLPAPGYAATRPMHARRAVADLTDDDGARIDQLLHGEAFDVLLTHGDRALGQARRDGVVGWVRLEALAPGASLPTHSVATLAADLPLNAFVRQLGEPAAPGLSPVGVFADDPAAVAETLLGRPWLAGGRSPAGVDGPGLMQLALQACGRAVPRRAVDQARLGRPVAAQDLRRGDLVAWPSADHAGLMLDADRLIHASEQAGAVTIETLSAVTDRLGPAILRRV